MSQILMLLFIATLVLFTISLIKKFKKKSMLTIGGKIIKPIYLGLFAVVLFISGVTVTSFTNQNKESNNKSLSSSNKINNKKVHNIGDTIKHKDFEFTVKKTEKRANIEWESSTNIPKDNYYYYVVYTNVKNISDKSDSIFFYTQSIQDKNNKQYDLQDSRLTYRLANNNNYEGRQNPNEERLLPIVFELPNEAIPQSICLNGGTQGINKECVKINLT